MPASDDDKLKKANKWGELALRYHPFYKGKIEVTPKCAVRSLSDFAIWYTPGVAESCKAIKANPGSVYEHTNKGNTVAVVSDGTRVLGLGDIGPEAGMPVMEGKALIFKYLGGVDAFPVCVGTKDPEEIINFCKWLAPSFGGINLEDIATPKCFYILERLRKEMSIPVWHDDQQGTAAIILAGVINSLKIVGKKMNEATITMIGSGAANLRAVHMLIASGIKPGNMILTDSDGILHRGRNDLREKEPYKWDFCVRTNSEGRTGGNAEAMKGIDVCIAASKPGPGTIKKEWVSSMATDSIIFACANPVPEIWPWEAKEAGAKVIATGRSDFPNQVNNSLGFPGIFRGTLDVRARTITDEMCMAAAEELAKCAEDEGIDEDHIIPTMEKREIYPREAAAVGMKAIEQGIARVKMSRNELYEKATKIIERSGGVTKLLMDRNFIRQPPE